MRVANIGQQDFGKPTVEASLFRAYECRLEQDRHQREAKP
jgi:hypothetical protein